MSPSIRYIESGFNVKGQAERLGVPFWRTPTLLFLLLGVVTSAFMIIVFYTARYAADPMILVLVEFGVVITTMTIGGFVIRTLEEIALVDKMKTDFISVASHKMKSPLAQIKWYVEHVQEEQGGKKLDPKVEEALKKITFVNDRLIRLVNDFLDVARVDAKSIHVYLERVDVRDVVEELARQYADRIKKKNITFLFEPFRGKTVVMSDKKKISVVLGNVLLNAIHYTEHGGSITISMHQSRGSLNVRIKDDGIGIPITHQKKVFEKFFRADNAAEHNAEGSGLGLYLSKKIMEHLKGDIWFESEKKKGTMFFIRIPY